MNWTDIERRVATAIQKAWSQNNKPNAIVLGQTERRVMKNYFLAQPWYQITDEDVRGTKRHEFMGLPVRYMEGDGIMLGYDA